MCTISSIFGFSEEAVMQALENSAVVKILLKIWIKCLVTPLLLPDIPMMKYRKEQAATSLTGTNSILK